MAETAGDRKVAVITIGYVYDQPGKPPLKIGTRLHLAPHEARLLRNARLVRLADEAEGEVKLVGPDRDTRTVMSPPPNAPPLSTMTVPSQSSPKQ